LKRFFIAAILLIGISSVANAQATRTWVSGVGDDANPCSRTAPCKTFAGAISKTASPGIINCLDPGGFGAVTITKSITIDCTGTYGSVLSSGVQGVIVNASTTDKVVLRGIDINGAGTTLGTNGVNIIQAGSVHLFDVNIANYSGRGIETTNSSNAIKVFVEHCQILNINGIGIAALSTSTGSTNLTVSNSHISNNGGDGIDIATGTPSTADVYNSVISKNAGVGFQIESGTTNATLDGNTITSNGTGVRAGIGGTPTVRLARNSITNNVTNGITGTGATKCFSNNMIDGNGGSNSCSQPLQGQQ
jgi:hypothetical protein